MSLARSTWTSSGCRPHHRHQRRGIEPGQQHILAALRLTATAGRSSAPHRGFRPAAGRPAPGRSTALPKSRQLARLAQRIAEQRRRPRSANRRPCLLRPRPARRTGTGARSDRVHVVAGVDHRALPAEDAPAATGATTARVTPSARLTAMVDAFGLIAGVTSIAALNGLPPVSVSSEPSAPRSTSASPSREKPATMPGRNPFAGGVDHFGSARHGDTRPPRRSGRRG